MQASKRKIQVGVVDDHDLLVAGVRALLSAADSPARFAAGARSVRDLLRTEARFDVVVLDVRLGDGSRLEENLKLLGRQDGAVLLHADRAHREAIPVLQHSHAHGLVWKNDPARELLRAVVAVARGEGWSPPGLQRAVELAPREREVLRLYVTGMKYAETAAALEPPVSIESVKTYLTRIRKRYAAAGRPASSRLELRRRAHEDGLLGPDNGEA